MHIHKLEKIWIVFGVTALLVFLIALGVSAFYQGNQPQACAATIDPSKVTTTAPFDNPGLHKVEGKDWDYELVYVGQAFSFNPTTVQIPVGSTVKIIATTTDVVHGLEIATTATNMMLEPGYVSENTQTFDKAGEYLVVCNEYCGTGHQMMYSKIEVTE